LTPRIRMARRSGCFTRIHLHARSTTIAEVAAFASAIVGAGTGRGAHRIRRTRIGTAAIDRAAILTVALITLSARALGLSDTSFGTNSVATAHAGFGTRIGFSARNAIACEESLALAFELTGLGRCAQCVTVARVRIACVTRDALIAAGHSFLPTFLANARVFSFRFGFANSAFATRIGFAGLGFITVHPISLITDATSTLVRARTSGFTNGLFCTWR